MKKTLLVALMMAAGVAHAEFVSGYTKANGTVVDSYCRGGSCSSATHAGATILRTGVVIGAIIGIAYLAHNYQDFIPKTAVKKEFYMVEAVWADGNKDYYFVKAESARHARVEIACQFAGSETKLVETNSVDSAPGEYTIVDKE